MKKIVNGKMYNTETAKCVGYQSHHAVSDFRYYEESLYQKKTGEFFLFGKGNGASPYCDLYGDLRGPGEDIRPITEKEAREWAEKHMSVDEYESVFGEVEE